MKLIKLLTLTLTALALSACSNGSSPSPSPTPSKKDFENVFFDSLEVTYDGNPHILGEVRGAPEGTTITYVGREQKVDVGTYPATAKLVKEGYNDKVLNATLTIKENKQDFEDVYFDSVTLTYDGLPHILGEVRGAPEGTTITYVGREEKTNVGTYPATAKLVKEGYNDKVLNASLTILPRDFDGLTYDSVSVNQDGLDHINDVKLVGFLPEGTKTNQVVKDKNQNIVTSAINAGKYYYSIEITNSNYNPLTLTATLTIVSIKKDMPVFVNTSGTTYFANGMDNGFLYSLNGTTLKKVSSSYPSEFKVSSDGNAIFIAKALLLTSVKEIDSSGVNSLYTDTGISDFVKYSDKIYYYSNNSLTSSGSGIYKVEVYDEKEEKEPTITKVFEGKSDNLVINGNYLYFTNGNDKDYIYKMDLNNYNTSLVYEIKTHEFIINNNVLYCSVNALLNDYIGYINLNESTIEIKKITNYAGEFLKIKDGYLYYNCTDLFSVIEPSIKGIWRVNISTYTNEQILQNEYINGFAVESSTSIIYNDNSNLHLYRYDISSKTATDLLDGFVPEEIKPYNIGNELLKVGNKLYYLNMYEEKTLYVYDEENKTNRQLTPNKVQNFFIQNNVIYFNQVTLLTNNDIYANNLLLSSESVKISTNDVRGMISDGTYIYGVHYNFLGVSGGLSRMKLDGSEYVKFSDVNGAKNLITRDNKLYYINCSTGQDNGKIEYIDLSTITPTSSDIKGTVLSDKIKNVKEFDFDGDNIFYIYNGTIENSIRRTSFSTLDEGTKIASSKTNPNTITLSGEYVYYYSYPVSSLDKAGFWRVRKDATKDGTQEMIASYQNKYYASNLVISGDLIYFFNYIAKLTFGDAHVYVLNLISKEISKIA